VGDDSLFRFFIGRFEPPTTSDEKSECSELPCLIPVFKFITAKKKLQNQVTLEFLKFCGLSGITVEHLVSILTFFEAIK